MPASKRKAQNKTGSSSKKPRVNYSAEGDTDDEELQCALRQIKEQEESEALARRLQEEWNQPAQSGSSTNVPDSLESDEAMARRLAAEWTGQDVDFDVEVVEAATNNSDERAVERVNTPDTLLVTFRDLFISSRPCTKCERVVMAPRGYVAYSDDELPSTLISLLHATCSCKTVHCRGCWKALSCPPKCKGKDNTNFCQATCCCAAGRAIAIFEVLGALDRVILDNKAAEEERAKTIAVKNRRQGRRSAIGPGGTGYGTGSTNSSYNHYTKPAHRKGKGKATVIEKKDDDSPESQWDEQVSWALLILAKLLPSPYEEEPNSFDLVPHESLGLLLSMSKLPDLLGGLLRNDSVTDWISRSQVYYATLTLLRRLSESELTVPVLIQPGWEKNTNSCGLEQWMWREGTIIWEKDRQGNVERTVPLYDHFSKLSKQSEAFLAGANNLVEDGGDHDELGVSLCGAIIEARDMMDRAIQVIGHKKDTASSDKGKRKDPETHLANTYHVECEKIVFKQASIDRKRYHYSRELDQTSHSTRNPRDRFHLIKELANLATVLPPGIWVRIDEVRTDMIKIMIAGPENTPYEGGLYEFDCFLPLEYPHKPPLLNLCNTAGGRVRFNPNLYANGKVCLSLLGTWPGRPEEQWSSKSTILQVLLSIQSFILIDTPYYNEPGMGVANSKSTQNLSYNKQVSLQNVRWAIVDWLSDENHNGLWADVIAMHFGVLKNRIRKRILEWAKVDSRIYAYDISTVSLCGTAGDTTFGTGGGRGSRLNLLHEFDIRVGNLAALPEQYQVDPTKS